LSVFRAEYQEHDLVARCEPVATVPADEFLLYHYGRTDNFLALDTERAHGALRPVTSRGR
jgi:hypothetical protein